MSERKVLNKYYPPDFDPSKIPKLKLPKDRQYVVRLMAPFNMRCKTCGEYIYKGKKFNARKETVQNEQYLGLPIFRFYIKCTRCLAEITFKTDPENTDYTMEHGATRNFQAEKLIEEEEKRFQKEREEEELNNPMKVLENRTKDSKMEMDVLENMQELIELNQRQANVDFDSMLDRYRETEEEMKKRQEEEDEKEMREMLSEANKRRKLVADSDSDEESVPIVPKHVVNINPTDILTKISNTRKHCVDISESNNRKSNSRQLISGFVRKHKVAQTNPTKIVNDNQPVTTAENTKNENKASVTCDTKTMNQEETISQNPGSTSHNPVSKPRIGASSLFMIGMYSDSEGSE